jgi:glycosyltransferase involved in cell wall biosynthesis
MKILQVAERTYPAKGGVELHTAKISEALVKKGHDVTLVVFNSVDPRDCGYGVTYQKPYLVTKPRKPVLPREEYWNGVRILRFESKIQLFSYYWSPTMLAWLLENAEEFDIMHTHTLRFSNNEFTALAHVKSKTPYVLTGHDKLKLDYMGPLALTVDKVYRATIGKLLLNMAERVIAFDKDYAEDYHRLYGVPNEKIRIIPNGIDYAYYNHLPNGDELTEILGNPENVILYIGRFIDYKKPDLLIASFSLVLKQFPKSCLLMIGKDYGLLPYCRKLAINLGLKEKVVFMEDAHEEIKLQALSIADVCVIPSDYEACPLVPLEAQASGVPVIASKCGGLKYLLEERKTGLFLKERTTKEIAEKIVCLLHNDGLRKQMSMNAREFARNFSWDVVTDKLLRVYKGVLG